MKNIARFTVIGKDRETIEAEAHRRAREGFGHESYEVLT